MEYTQLTRTFTEWTDIAQSLRRRHDGPLIDIADSRRVADMIGDWLDTIDPKTPINKPLSIQVSQQTAQVIAAA